MFISIRRPVYSNQKPAYGKENLQISISCAGDEETLTDCDFSYNPYCPNYQQIECGSKLSLSKIYRVIVLLSPCFIKVMFRLLFDANLRAYILSP